MTDMEMLEILRRSNANGWAISLTRDQVSMMLKFAEVYHQTEVLAAERDNAANERDLLGAALNAMKTERDQLLAALEAVEWSARGLNPDDPEMGGVVPCCPNPKCRGLISDGHTPRLHRRAGAEGPAVSGFVILSNQKPAEGEPCNGCGMCCQNEACDLSVEYLKSSVAPCIALEWTGSNYTCGLVKNASRYLGTKEFGDPIIGGLFATMLGVGEGCDSEDPPYSYRK